MKQQSTTSLVLFRSLIAVQSLVWTATTLAGGIPTLETVEVTSDASDLIGEASSATQGTVTAQQLETRPLLRPAEVLEEVPGMIISQHSGDGKANQYYLRGFNLDHGTDFATTLMGMPVNLPSNAHGQGYSDLQFLIPELVERMQYRKGPLCGGSGRRISPWACSRATTTSARWAFMPPAAARSWAPSARIAWARAALPSTARTRSSGATNSAASWACARTSTASTWTENGPPTRARSTTTSSTPSCP